MSNIEDPGKIPMKKYKAWNREINVDPKAMLFGLVKLIGIDLTGAGENAASGLSFPEKIESLAYHLIYNALSNALKKLVEDNRDIIFQEGAAFLALRNQLRLEQSNEEITEAEYETNRTSGIESIHEVQGKKIQALTLKSDDQDLKIGREFLRNPRSLTIIEDFKPDFEFWLTEIQGLAPHTAGAIVKRFPTYFVLELHVLWREKKEYSRIEKELFKVTSDAVEREIARIQYNSWLQRIPDEKMFDEAFGVSEVYIPLRGQYEIPRTEENKDKPRVIVKDAESHIMKWLDKGSPFLVVKGGPGSGKSVLAKRISARVSEEKPHFVYHIPMHRFLLDTSLKAAIQDFIKSDQYLHGEDPFEANNPEGSEEVLFVFDGLDELAKTGAVGLELARKFVEDLVPLVTQMAMSRGGNLKSSKVKVLLTGRDLVIQQNEQHFDEEGQIIRLLPFHKGESSIDKNDIKTGNKIYEKDQRPLWWEKYQKVKGLTNDELQNKILNSSDSEIQSISAEPLLNYLLARALQEKADLLDHSKNLNEVYRILVVGIHERTHAGERKYIKITTNEFQRILEEIAICAWHGGDVRVTTFTRIRKRAKENRLESLFDKFDGMEEEGFMRLLVSFFFHQRGIEEQGEKSVEFTHKSFGEYLTALRIVREMEIIVKNYQRSEEDYSGVFGPKEALDRWLYLCGESTMGPNIHRFLRREVMLQNTEKVKAWQQVLVKLFNYTLRHDWPFPKEYRNEFKEAFRKIRNAQESILLLLGSCGQTTKEVSNIDWPNEYSAGELISRLCPQYGGGGELSLKGFSYVNLYGQHVDHKDLRSGWFEGASLIGASLIGAILVGARLVGARLDGAILDGARLDLARLDGASLVGAILRRASLDGARLDGAILDGASLDGASLDGARLDGAILDGARLDGAILRRASLVGARLDGARLDGARLDGAYFNRKTRITVEQLSYTYFDFAYFEKGKVSKVKLMEIFAQ